MLDSYGYTYKQWDVFINKWYGVCSVWILWINGFSYSCYVISQHATEYDTRKYSEIVEFNKWVDHPSNRSLPLTPFPFTFSSNNSCIFIINPVSSTISNNRFYQFIINEFSNIERDLIGRYGVTSIWYKLNYDRSLYFCSISPRVWYSHIPFSTLYPVSYPTRLPTIVSWANRCSRLVVETLLSMVIIIIVSNILEYDSQLYCILIRELWYLATIQIQPLKGWYQANSLTCIKLLNHLQVYS